MAKYAIDNWRSHRTFGVSAMLPWDQGALWKTPKNVNPKPHLNDLSVLKQPGLFPDRMNAMPAQFIYGKTDPEGWEPSPLGEAFLRWNQDTCAFIGGMEENFTDKSHTFRQGESIQKTIVLINDTRRTRVVTVNWRCQSVRKSFKAKLKPGTITLYPISCVVGDSGLQTHTFTSRIMMTAKFDNGDVWTDQFDFQTLPIQDKLLEGFSAWIYDPKGMTTKYMQEISMLTLKPLTADASIDFDKPQDPIIIGREALDDPTAIKWLPDAISKGKVLIFEQSYDALTKRLGFRANIHGLRELFVTKYIHPAFRDCISPMEENEEQAANTALKNWRGASTMTPPYLDVPEQETHNPKWNWLGFENTRVWTAGNQGTVASILIEKPEIGNWRPLAVGGFDLQYTALMELIVNKGRTIFCQLDVTNRTENDPVADRIACRLVHYLIYAPDTGIKRKVYYAGGPEGRELLVKLKVNFEDHKPFTEDLNVDSDDYKANLTKKLEHPSLLNDILFLAHGAPRKILEQTNLNAQEPKNILEKLDRAEKVPAGLVAVGLDLKELTLAGLSSDFKVDFDIRNYEKIIDYLEHNEFKEEVEELKLLIEQGITKDIDQALLHIKEKLELARLDFDPVPEYNYNKLKRLIIYLERIGFKNESKELARVEAEGIPNILEETLNRIELKTKQAGLDKGASLAIAVPLPEENHLEKKGKQKRNKEALKDYIKNKPDIDIAETAFEMLRGMTSADIYWHASLAKTAVAASPKDEIDKYVLSVPSLFALVHERRATICLQAGPWDFDYVAKPYLRTSYRRSVFAIAKLLANLGAEFYNPILEIVANPPQENAWLNSYYLQEPQAEDDPYRYYRW